VRLRRGVSLQKRDLRARTSKSHRRNAGKGGLEGEGERERERERERRREKGRKKDREKS
jgi:hypothetical protein